MPYKYNRKKKPVKSYKKKRTGQSSIARKVNMLMRSAMPERKIVDQQKFATTIDNAGSVSSHLAYLAQGDDDEQRTGTRINVRSIYMRGVAEEGGTTSQLIRLIVFRDTRQVADSTPTVAQVLDNSLSNYLLAPLNNDTRGRFDILYDRIITTRDADKKKQFFKWYKKCFVSTRFNGSASTDIERNGLYILAVSDIASGSNPPTLTLHTRVVFTDA